MFFLARCAICLGIVFYWMPWPSPPFEALSSAALDAPSGGSESFMMTMGRKAAVKLGESCIRMPAECLNDVPNLTSVMADAAAVLPPRRPPPRKPNEPEGAHLAAGHKSPAQR